MTTNQSWYWTEQWQTDERQADEDITAGHVRIFYTTGEAITWLSGDERAGVAESGRMGGDRASTDPTPPGAWSGQQNRIDPTASHPGTPTT